ncbi:MAG: imidazolonepropionase, partial [Actinomycetota bacterium]|nr:imidazolonepropionase [Actinomycetota bacterium]
MTSLLLDDIGLLVTNDPAIGDGPLGLLRDAALICVEGKVAWVGPAATAQPADRRIDAGGRCVIPGFVDSHTHLVFAGDRAEEFAARMAGRPYSAGGIATTVAATRRASDTELAGLAAALATEALQAGTTTIEIKSGYGLTVRDEQRSLQVARQLTGETTYLGAHVVPPEYAGRPDDYVALVAGEMLDACAPHAKWADVFCDRGAFDADQARTVLKAAEARGLGLRVHANQLRPGPGAQLAVEMGAASADHCTHLSDDDVDAVTGSGTVVTLLPGAEFATRSAYPDGHRLMAAGATVALASDCNPGSSYTTNLPFCIAVAVREMGLTPDEALWSATQGGARALRRDDVGLLSPGARADAVILNAPTHVHLAYRAGVPLIH